MSARVILNPYAGRWKAKRLRPETVGALKAAGVEYTIVESQGTWHAAELAEQAALEGDAPIIVAGGDGTIGEVINGLHRANPEGPLGPLGLIPLGTANDLMTNLDLPLGLQQAANAIAGGRTQRIDLGMANDWVFANNSAVGLEPVVSIYNVRMVRLRGVIRYLVAALRAIADQPEWNARLQWDDGEYEGPLSLASVGNCPLTGGLFRMAPAADPTDGQLTFVHGYAPTKLRMLSLLPRAISGDYVNDPAVHQHHTKRLTIHTEPSTPLQLDGEIRSEGLAEVTYTCLPARLDILAP